MDIEIMVKRTSIASSHSDIAARREFNTGGGLYARRSFGSTGYLRGEARDAYYADANTIDYVVVSYATPIAWHTPEAGWTYVDQRFSVSTSKHQGQAKWGIGSEARVLNRHYYLSDAQRSLLLEATSQRKYGEASNPAGKNHVPHYITVTGQARRTAAKLVELGLLVNSATAYLGTEAHAVNDNYKATDAAMAWARS